MTAVANRPSGNTISIGWTECPRNFALPSMISSLRSADVDAALLGNAAYFCDQVFVDRRVAVQHRPHVRGVSSEREGNGVDAAVKPVVAQCAQHLPRIRLAC